MSASLELAPTKHQYFTTDTGNLYYVVDILMDGDYLIEDCKTLDVTWISAKSMSRLTWLPVVVAK